MDRFFVPSSNISAENIFSTDDKLLHQLNRVLRLKNGDKILFFDNSGFEYEVVIETLEKKSLRGKILAKYLSDKEPVIKINLYQSFLKGDKLELVVQKGVELGVNCFIFFPSQNSNVKNLSPNKINRYQEIAREATEQCGGAKLAQISFENSFESVVNNLSKQKDYFNFILDVGEKYFTPEQILKKEKFGYNILIGPEGGFSQEEILLANKQGIKSLSLGKRVLRAETAGLALTARLLI